MMTFEQFVASRVRSENLNAVTGYDEAELGGPTPGYVYLPRYDDNGTLREGFWISEGYEGSAKPLFHLVCWRDEYESYDLAELERTLWDTIVRDELAADQDVEHAQMLAALIALVDACESEDGITKHDLQHAKAVIAKAEKGRK